MKMLAVILVSVSLAACSLPKAAGPIDWTAKHADYFHTRLAAIVHGSELASRKHYTYFLKSDEINAMATDRYVIFSTAVVESADPDLSDAVIAHELAHSILRHSTVKVAASVVVSAAMIAADSVMPVASTASPLVNRLVVNTFSRSQEIEADDKAIEMLTRTYQREGVRHPHRQAREAVRYALEVLYRKYGDSGGNILDAHPALSFRIQRLK